MNQMDQVTQQNAAMVEETTASSVTLAEEAQTLKTLVARFRTSYGTQDNAGALRAAAQQMRAPAPARRASPAPAPVRKPRPQTHGANALAQDAWEEF
jgi:methyl-accepting chemotaxis protein